MLLVKERLEHFYPFGCPVQNPGIVLAGLAIGGAGRAHAAHATDVQRLDLRQSSLAVVARDHIWQ